MSLVRKEAVGRFNPTTSTSPLTVAVNAQDIPPNN